MRVKKKTKDQEYWDDPRWREVSRLRKERQEGKARKLIEDMRISCGLKVK